MLKNNNSIFRHGAPFLVLATIMILASCTICPNDGDQVDNTYYAAAEEFSHTYPVENQTLFTIEGINGNITIEARSGIDSITIEGERKVESESYEDAEECLEELEVYITGNNNEYLVVTHQPSHSDGRNFIIHYHIIIPDYMRTTIYNVNGDIFVDSLNNKVYAAQTNGTINLSEINGSIEAGLTNGNIITGMALPGNGICRLNTVNGNVILSVPDTTSAHLSANIVNGVISISGLTLESQVSSPYALTGVLNDGNGTIDLDVVNGSINISKKF